MQYNESLYNGDSYNLTEYSTVLIESIIPTDTDVAKSVSIVRTDSQGTADVLGGSASLQAFLETVTIYQRANTPFAYNNGRYNDYMYNARADEDEVLLTTTKALSDSLSSADFIASFILEKALSETMTDVDSLSLSPSLSLIEFLFLSEFFRIEITNKALNDTVQINDWVTIKQNPQSVEWYD